MSGSTPDLGRRFLDDALLTLDKTQRQAEGALAQVDDAGFFRRLDPGSNCLATIVKHVAGNQRSRWTDFPASDGEKPDRDRDGEFEIGAADGRESLMAAWRAGWGLTRAAIAALRPEQLTDSVTIRGESHSILEAIDRQVAHYAHHAGQIVFLSKHLAGERWRTLSIPRGRSADFEVARDGTPYRIGPAGGRCP